MNASKDHGLALLKSAPRIEAVGFDNHWLMLEGGMVFTIRAYLDENKEEIDIEDEYYNDAWFYAVEVPWSDDFLIIPSYAYPDMPTYTEN